MKEGGIEEGDGVMRVVWESVWSVRSRERRRNEKIREIRSDRVGI